MWERFRGAAQWVLARWWATLFVVLAITIPAVDVVESILWPGDDEHPLGPVVFQLPDGTRIRAGWDDPAKDPNARLASEGSESTVDSPVYWLGPMFAGLLPSAIFASRGNAAIGYGMQCEDDTLPSFSCTYNPLGVSTADLCSSDVPDGLTDVVQVPDGPLVRRSPDGAEHAVDTGNKRVFISWRIPAESSPGVDIPNLYRSLRPIGFEAPLPPPVQCP